MPFGRAKPSNRSQHSLVDPGLGAPGGAPAADPTTAQQGAHAQHQSAAASTPPSTGGDAQGNSTSSIALNRRPSDSSALFIDHHQQKHDFDQVARSQSHRYPVQVPVHPAAYGIGIASSSFEDLPNHQPPVTSPLASPHQQHLAQQQPPPPPEARRSTRKLIKNYFNRTSDQQQQQQQQHQQQQHHSPQPSIDQSGPQRRTSHSASQTPPIRTAISQLSLDQPPVDWQAQPQAPLSQQQHLHQQQPPSIQASPNPQHEQLHTTIRHVQSDVAASPFGPPHSEQAGAFQQQHGHVFVPDRRPSQDNQHTYGQVQFDPSHQQQQFQFQHHPPQGHYHHQSGASSLFTGLLEPSSQHRNPETISQLSHDSPVTDVDLTPSNLHSAQTSPAVNFAPRSQELSQSPSQLLAQTLVQGQDQAQVSSAPAESSQRQQEQPGKQQQQQQPSQTQQPQQSQQPQPPQQQQAPREDTDMAPQAQGGPPAANRRSTETDKNMRGQLDPPPGPPPSFRHSQASPGNPMQQANAGGLNQNYRQSSAQDRQFDGAAAEGRNSPQPTPAGEPAESEKAFKELLTKYKNVKRLYFDGKNQIEQLSGQVEQLQNAVANQRISQSRTSLDDNEYSTRFNRLNGAINNLSFNIRKDWVIIPPFLEGYVSPDALRTGKQEMTAVGRAAITSWVLDFVFDRCFHPGLDSSLSHSLKQIEQNIRSFSYTMNSQEEFDALTSKVVSWRMATLEGLQPMLQSPQSAEHRAAFTAEAARNLTSKLFDHLATPPPAGVDGSVSMIVELAVGIASNLPMESRDVAITFPSPGSPMQPNIMEVEKTTGLPPLENRPSEAERDADSDDEDRSGKEASGREAKGSSKNNSRPDKAGKSASSSTSNLPPKDSNKIRFAGFVAVEVRGRQVLVKAPVWTMA